jgi:hypothetical protein
VCGSSVRVGVSGGSYCHTLALRVVCGGKKLYCCWVGHHCQLSAYKLIVLLQFVKCNHLFIRQRLDVVRWCLSQSMTANVSICVRAGLRSRVLSPTPNAIKIRKRWITRQPRLTQIHCCSQCALTLIYYSVLKSLKVSLEFFRLISQNKN